jgi:hypothetical protein
MESTPGAEPSRIQAAVVMTKSFMVMVGGEGCFFVE